MIVLRSTYSGSADEVGALRPAHLEWLEGLITDGLVIAAGRLDDGSGAVIVGAGTNAAALIKDFDVDPYVAGGVASYEELATFPIGMGGDVVKQLDAR
jgi:uncharacterized protein YciI